MMGARLFGLLALLALSCGPDETALVLEARSEMPPDALDQVVFRVSGPGIDGGTHEAIAPVVGPGAKSFPLTLVLVASGNATGPFTVVIEGRKEGVARAQAVPVAATPITFVPGKVTRHQFVLRAPETSAPSSMPMPDAGAPPMSLPPMGLPPSCGPGCVCAETCSKTRPCTCSMGCACQFGCSEGDQCVFDCSGPGTTCHIDLGMAKSGQVNCTSAALCVVRAGQEEEGDTKVRCDNAQCELQCGDESSCKLECTEGARCLIRCGGDSCKLDCPHGQARDCSDGVRVCNRECP